MIDGVKDRHGGGPYKMMASKASRRLFPYGFSGESLRIRVFRYLGAGVFQGWVIQWLKRRFYVFFSWRDVSKFETLTRLRFDMTVSGKRPAGEI